MKQNRTPSHLHDDFRFLLKGTMGKNYQNELLRGLQRYPHLSCCLTCHIRILRCPMYSKQRYASFFFKKNQKPSLFQVDYFVNLPSVFDTITALAR